MSAFSQRPRLSAGFSLVELLVALVFTGLLMAGMARVFAASANFFATSHETMGIQRNARWALSLLQDDMLQAGYLLPPRIVTELFSHAQPALMIETSATALKYTGSDGVERTLPVKPDEIQVVMDIPLNIEGSLSAAPAQMGNSLSLTIPSGGDSLQIGDLAFVQDSASELFKIGNKSGSAGTYTLTLESVSGLMDDEGNEKSTFISPFVMRPHRTGAQVTFIRPLQVVSYTLEAIGLDPGNSSATVPCLVRRTKAVGATTWGPSTVLVEGVTGLSLDWSLNGGVDWIRRKYDLTSKPWSDVKSKTNEIFKAQTNPLARQLLDQATQGLDSTIDPFWFNYTPVLIRMEVETQTRLQRTEFNATYDPNNPQAAFRTRRETLMVSSRNFAQSAP